MTDKPTVIEALSAVMEAVRTVHKGDRNKQQGFNFRGVDAVVNAVGPVLRTNGVVVVPLVEDISESEFTTKDKGTRMHQVVVRTRYRFYGPAGDHIEAVTYGEAADAGDKAVTKAQSVALRIALLQALCIPTDEPDPDSMAYERNSVSEEVNNVHRQIIAAGEARGMDPSATMADFNQWSNGGDVRHAELKQLLEYLDHLDQVATA